MNYVKSPLRIVNTSPTSDSIRDGDGREVGVIKGALFYWELWDTRIPGGMLINTFSSWDNCRAYAGLRFLGTYGA